MRSLILAFAVPLLASCDKAGEIIGKARSVVEEQLDTTAKESERDQPDPALLAQVDETGEGVIFRKDLPFPKNLTVRETRSTELKNARVFLRSELGAQSAVLRDTNHLTTLYQSIGEDLRIILETLQSVEPPANTLPDAKPVTTVDLLQGGIIDFRFTDGKWTAVGTTDFTKAVWQRDLLPHVPSLLVHAGLRPRPLWFAKTRLKPGETIAIGDALMPMFFDEKTTGNLELVFEAQEAVHGHPCGVFSIRGNYHRKNAASSDGTLADEEVTIESGKIWLSLLHPVILREELQTIQTRKSGKSGSPPRHIQGELHIKATREWTPGAE